MDNGFVKEWNEALHLPLQPQRLLLDLASLKRREEKRADGFGFMGLLKDLGDEMLYGVCLDLRIQLLTLTHNQDLAKIESKALLIATESYIQTKSPFGIAIFHQISFLY